MTSTSTQIIKIDLELESEFNNIYRITTENGLILDIYESKKPELLSIIEYSINKEIDATNVTMNGIIYEFDSTSIYVSFGGLLGKIPRDTINSFNSDNFTISISYKLCHIS